MTGESREPDRLGAADAGEMFTLQRAAYLDEGRVYGSLDLPALAETLEQLRAALSDPACFAWGTRDRGRLVATVRIRVRDQVGEVGRLAVAPDRQGEGLAGALLHAAERRLPGSVTRLRLFTGERSLGPLRLYQRLGYTETHRTPELDYHLVHLEKPRNSAGHVPAEGVR